MTQREIAESLGITREQVRQIQESALRKLSHPTRKRMLEPFYEETTDWEYICSHECNLDIPWQTTDGT